MKKMIQHLFAILLLATSVSSHAALLAAPDISISPTPSTTDDYLYATVSGSYVTAGHLLINTPVANISANTIDIDFFIDEPDGPASTVIIDFSYVIDLGFLNEGNYDINAYFYMDSFIDQVANNSLTVSAVPVPAAVWLLMSGLLTLLTVGRVNRNNKTV